MLDGAEGLPAVAAPRKMFAGRTNWNLESNRLSQALARHRAAGKPLLDLTASNPTKCGFRNDESAVLRALANPRSLVYEPRAQGLEAARQAVAGYYSKRGDQVAIGDILLTTSTSEAYSFVFRLLCDPGDEVLVPSPSYPLFDFLAGLEDVKLVRYPLVYDYGWQIDLGELPKAMTARTRAIIVVHPNNPTGHFCSAPERTKLNEICAREKMALMADEVFLDFGLDGERSESFVGNQDVLTFTMSGISKLSGLPQMKLAWLALSGPAELKSQALARLEVIADTYLSIDAPVQHAAATLLDQRSRFQSQWADRVRRNLGELDKRLAGQKSCSRLEIQGGWYAVIRVPRTQPDEDLAIALLHEKHTYVHPGHFYDFPSEGYLVVSVITPTEEFAEGIENLLSIVA
jgi:alanine-synthesizing transaminase